MRISLAGAEACLQGWHIVIMRPRHQAQGLVEMIKAKRGEVIVLPMIDILPVAVSIEDETIKRADIIIVTSANAVYCAPSPLLESMKHAHCVVTMGKATSQALTDKNIPIYFTAPPGSTSETLLMQDFLAKSKVQAKNITILAGEGGRTVLADELQNREAVVTWLKVYRQQRPHLEITSVLQQWQHISKLCFIATSSRSLENLLTLSNSEYHTWLKARPLVVVSARIAHQAKEWGFQHIYEANAAHPENILVALQAMVIDYDNMTYQDQ